MPHGDRYLESTGREDKFQLDQIISRFGKKFKITRIVWDRVNKRWDIYGIEVFT